MHIANGIFFSRGINEPDTMGIEPIQNWYLWRDAVSQGIYDINKIIILPTHEKILIVENICILHRNNNRICLAKHYSLFMGRRIVISDFKLLVLATKLISIPANFSSFVNDTACSIGNTVIANIPKFSFPIVFFSYLFFDCFRFLCMKFCQFFSLFIFESIKNSRLFSLF